MFKALSQELIDFIIDLVAEDESSVRSCSLVSSVFRERSQFHLFRSISLLWRTRGPASAVVQRLHTVLHDRPILARATTNLILDFSWLVNLEQVTIGNCMHLNTNNSSFVEELWRPYIVPQVKVINLVSNPCLPAGIFTECPNLDKVQMLANIVINCTRQSYAAENTAPMRPKSLTCTAMENLWPMMNGVGNCRIDFSAVTNLIWMTTAWTPHRDGNTIPFVTSQAKETLQSLTFTGIIGWRAGTTFSLADMRHLHDLTILTTHYEDWDIMQQNHHFIRGTTSLLNTVSRHSGLRHLNLYVEILYHEESTRDQSWLSVDLRVWHGLDKAIARWQQLVDGKVSIEILFAVAQSTTPGSDSDIFRAAYCEALSSVPTINIPLASGNPRIDLRYSHKWS